MIKLRAEVKDNITGLHGIVVHRDWHISGCITYGIQPLTNPSEHQLASIVTLESGRIMPARQSFDDISEPDKPFPSILGKWIQHPHTGDEGRVVIYVENLYLASRLIAQPFGIVKDTGRERDAFSIDEHMAILKDDPLTAKKVTEKPRVEPETKKNGPTSYRLR